MKPFTLGALVLLAGASGTEAFAQSVSASPAAPGAFAGALDYAHAKPIPLRAPTKRPQSAAAQPLPNLGPSGASSDSSQGDGVLRPVRVAPEQPIGPGPRSGASAIAPQQFGTLNHPFSTARVQLGPLATNPPQQPTVYSFPYRASGKLFFRDGAATFVCSASLIKRGLVVTAAHCVAEFGQNRYYTQFQYIPAYHNGAAPFGTWNGQQAYVRTSYLNGTDPCAEAGIVCANDVAVIRLAPKTNPVYPGTSTGWFNFAFGNWGFTSSGTTLINQLGYPVALDNGQLEQRNDSQGFRDATMSNNTIIGSLMTGGSSGGPWLNNLGFPPSLNGTSFGSFAAPNIVIGVTSWGYVSSGPKEQGASPFTTGNIVALVNAACAPVPAACQ